MVTDEFPERLNREFSSFSREVIPKEQGRANDQGGRGWNPWSAIPSKLGAAAWPRIPPAQHRDSKWICPSCSHDGTMPTCLGSHWRGLMSLVTVLWGIALLSIVAMSFLSSGSASYRIARNSVEVAQVDAIAEAGVVRAVLSLLDSLPDGRWRTDGVARRLELGGIPVSVSIQDELGRIDINHADGTLLVRVFQAAGLDNQAASALVDKVLDWRDSNPLKRLNGADAQDYRVAGSSSLPRKGPFQSIDELKLVMGMTPDLFRRVEPALTVYSTPKSY